MSDSNPLIPLIELGLRLEQIEPDATLGFSCRGCGQLCCVNQDIFLTPPEFARIDWFLQRNAHFEKRLRDHNIQWANLFIGHSTGLPGMNLAFLPFNSQKPERGTYCPFLSPVVRQVNGAPEPTGMHWCGLHHARPGACRIYPVGRISTDGNSNIRFVIVNRCPGFEASPKGTPLPPGYAPPDARQTVNDWLRDQLLPDLEVERDFYIYSVIDALMSVRCHAPTDDNPDGTLTDDEAIALGVDVIYNVPPAPADPANDHATLMAWMTAMMTRDAKAPPLPG